MFEDLRLKKLSELSDRMIRSRISIIQKNLETLRTFSEDKRKVVEEFLKLSALVQEDNLQDLKEISKDDPLNKKLYRAIAKECHPDKNTLSSEVEKKNKVHIFMLADEAYLTGDTELLISITSSLNSENSEQLTEELVKRATDKCIKILSEIHVLSDLAHFFISIELSIEKMKEKLNKKVGINGLELPKIQGS